MGTTSFDVTLLLNQGEIFKSSTTRKHRLGTRGFTRDGRVYRYSRAGATAITPGMLCQAPAYSASFTAVSLADSTDWAVPTTGSTLIRLATDVTMTATASQLYTDGYFMVTAGSTGNEVGQMLQIESLPQTTGAADPNTCPSIYLYQEDKLVTALTTANTVSLIANPYNQLIPAPSNDAAITGIGVGVCPCNVAALEYFWLQTWGMSCIRVSGTLDTGHIVQFASDTGCSRTGTVKAISSKAVDKGAPEVGYAQYIGTDGYAGGVFLTLAP